jgi:hypothetical protein
MPKPEIPTFTVPLQGYIMLSRLRGFLTQEHRLLAFRNSEIPNPNMSKCRLPPCLFNAFRISRFAIPRCKVARSLLLGLPGTRNTKYQIKGRSTAVILPHPTAQILSGSRGSRILNSFPLHSPVPGMPKWPFRDFPMP